VTQPTPQPNPQPLHVVPMLYANGTVKFLVAVVASLCFVDDTDAAKLRQKNRAEPRALHPELGLGDYFRHPAYDVWVTETGQHRPWRNGPVVPLGQGYFNLGALAFGYFHSLLFRLDWLYVPEAPENLVVREGYPGPTSTFWYVTPWYRRVLAGFRWLLGVIELPEGHPARAWWGVTANNQAELEQYFEAVNETIDASYGASDYRVAGVLYDYGAQAATVLYVGSSDRLCQVYQRVFDFGVTLGLVRLPIECAAILGYAVKRESEP
jgi:hypothetical protein